MARTRPVSVSSSEAGSDEVAPHRLARGQRLTEVEARQIAQVVEELHRQAPVETEARTHLVDGLLARRRTREERGGIARQRAREQERHDHDAGEARQRRGEAPADHAQGGMMQHRRGAASPSAKPG